MAEIHPTSIVDPDAELASDVTVGPLCVIEAGVRLGSGTRLIGSVYLRGPLVVGKNNVMYPGVRLGFEPQDSKIDLTHQGPGVVIGDDGLFREGSTIHRATRDTPTTLGDGVLMMVGGHVGHDCYVGDRCVLTNNSALAGHVHLEEQVIVSGGAQIHQFARVGTMAMIGGGVGMVGDVPPYAMARFERSVCGINVVGLRRAKMREHIDPLKQAYNLLYHRSHTNKTAAKLIREQLGHDPCCVRLAEFVENAKRGLAPWDRRSRMYQNGMDDDFNAADADASLA